MAVGRSTGPAGTGRAWLLVVVLTLAVWRGGAEQDYDYEDEEEDMYDDEHTFTYGDVYNFDDYEADDEVQAEDGTIKKIPRPKPFDPFYIEPDTFLKSMRTNGFVDETVYKGKDEGRKPLAPASVREGQQLEGGVVEEVVKHMVHRPAEPYHPAAKPRRPYTPSPPLHNPPNPPPHNPPPQGYRGHPETQGYDRSRPDTAGYEPAPRRPYDAHGQDGAGERAPYDGYQDEAPAPHRPTYSSSRHAAPPAGSPPKPKHPPARGAAEPVEYYERPPEGAVREEYYDTEQKDDGLHFRSSRENQEPQADDTQQADDSQLPADAPYDYTD